MSDFTPPLRDEIESAINRCSAENASNTPDFILAEFLTDCLKAFDKTIAAREQWYGREHPVISDWSKPAPEPMSPEHAAVYHGDIDGDADPWIG